MPPVTCDWNFYIASDDGSKLYLSSNDDPANKDLVASVNGHTGSKQWKKMTSQKGTVSLVKGELYYLEAIHKEGGGGDNLAVGCGNALNMIFRWKSLVQSSPELLFFLQTLLPSAQQA